MFTYRFTKRSLLLICGGLLALVLACCAVLFIFSHSNDSNHVIELRKDGFHPSKLVIKEGDTVTFKTNTNEAYWPASNPHPTHTEYPVFDPKKPIAPDSTWQFTFTQAGTFPFHDHIKSIYAGEIIVTRSDGSRVTVDCTTEKTQQCWEKMMLETLEKEGVKATFDQLLYLSQTEPGFADDCHGFSHTIGKEAYKLYVAKENFELTPAASLCGYGFFHGFMETMLLTTGNIDEAREFCKEVDRKLSGQASAAATACYHGIGHGAIDGSDQSAWGDIDAMMAPGFKLCGIMAKNELESYLCTTGVFNAIEILSADPKYGIEQLQADPFPVCNKQPIERREGCYSNMLPIVMKMTGNDFQKSFDYINKNMIDNNVTAIDGNTINDLVTLGLMFEYIRMYGETDGYAEKGIEFCRKQNADDRLPCIEGLSGGHIKYGKPGVEYVKNLEFCENKMLTADEKDACYKYTLPRLSNRYNQEETQMICNKVPVDYREKYCPKPSNQ